MVGSLIIRGVIVGIVAGLLGFAFAKTFGEPAVNVAIAFETSHDEATRAAQIAHGIAPASEQPEIFSRNVQGGIGLFTGVVVVGAGIGGLFAVLFAFANGRMGAIGPGTASVLLAFYGFWSVYLIPALKYPPNPPSIGDPDTIKLRTGLYFLMMAISIATTIGSLVLRQRLVDRFGAWLGSVVAFGVYLVVICVFFAILPDINEVPQDFPAVTLWQFRMTSLGIQTILWGSIGLMFGWLVERPLGSTAARPSTAMRI